MTKLRQCGIPQKPSEQLLDRLLAPWLCLHIAVVLAQIRKYSFFWMRTAPCAFKNFHIWKFWQAAVYRLVTFNVRGVQIASKSVCLTAYKMPHSSQQSAWKSWKTVSLMCAARGGVYVWIFLLHTLELNAPSFYALLVILTRTEL